LAVRVTEKKPPTVAQDGNDASGAKRTIAKNPGNTVNSNRRLDSLML